MNGLLKKIYDKSKLTFALICIVAYCILLSVSDSLSAEIGVEKLITLPVSLLFSLILLFFLKKNGLFEAYGLCRSKIAAKDMLFYIPLLLMLSVNLWNGISFNLSPAETLLYILSMFCVGFLEEIIFRGFLFNAMKNGGLVSAIVVSSITFGIGHIINLINGSGAELIPNLLQIVYAAAAGFMFVMIYYKTESLILCIFTHGMFNALSIFSNETALTLPQRIATCIFLTVVTGAYALYIAFKIKNQPIKSADEEI